MKMSKKVILLSIFLLNSISVFSQEEQHPDLLVTDDWGKELFTFPIKFAQKIPYSGIEEARFPKGWGKEDSPYFWTYAFAWKIDFDTLFTAAEFETNLQYYFDGLLGLDFDQDKKNSNALFLETNEANGTSTYLGKIKTLDTRFTKKQMTLHVKISQEYCEKSKKLIVLFKFSPKEFENGVWSKLNEIEFSPDACK